MSSWSLMRVPVLSLSSLPTRNLSRFAAPSNLLRVALFGFALNRGGGSALPAPAGLPTAGQRSRGPARLFGSTARKPAAPSLTT